MFPSETEAARMFHILGHPVVEMRIIKRSGDILTGYFDDAAEFGDAAAGLSKPATGPDVCGVYVTLNRLAPFFSELATNMVAPGRATRAANIERYTHLLIDLDPVRSHPAGGKVCSTDAEHQAALDVAARIAESLPGTLVMDSGSGAYVIAAVDLPNTPASQQLLSSVLAAIAAKYGTEAVHVDTSVADAARVVRVAGTMNRKSPHDDERPNRSARIISAPDELVPLTIERLNEIAGTRIEPVEAEHQAVPVSDDDFLNVDDLHQYRVDTMLTALTRVGIKVAARHDSDFSAIDLPYCPFKGGDHTDGRTAILIWRDGPCAVKCFHSKCSAKKWTDLVKVLKLPFDDVAKDMATKQVLGDIERSVDDPLALAKHYLAETAQGGTPTLANFRDETYRYSDTDAWTLTSSAEMETRIRPAVQAVFDRHAAALSRLKGVPEMPKPIRGGLISDVYKAAQSLVSHDVSKSAVAPFWLRPNDWAADDILVLRNGILNLREFLGGREHFRSLTPELFYEHQSAFGFDLQAAPPLQWLRFLRSLDRDEEWSNCLQQILGYALWPAWNLQKYVTMYGPPRAGKGVISDVLTQLVGGESAACGLRLQDFATEFGLEQAVGKRVAIVPEIRVPEKSAHEIVARIKAVTGGDLVTVNRKGIKGVSMRLPLLILMQSNHFVALPDNSGALHARCLPLKLVKSFKGAEDETLGQRLNAELPGILNWALDGLRKLWASGGKFTLPESSRNELDQLLEEAAPLQTFVSECAIVDSSRAVQSPALYAIYSSWMDAEHPADERLTEAEFANELRAAVPSITKVRAASANERSRNGCQIITTPYDDHESRARLWLGIYPQNQWCLKPVRPASHLRY